MLIHHLAQNQSGTERCNPTLYCLPLYNDFYSPHSLMTRSKRNDDFGKLSDLNRHFYGNGTCGSSIVEPTNIPLSEPEHTQNPTILNIRSEIWNQHILHWWRNLILGIFHSSPAVKNTSDFPSKRPAAEQEPNSYQYPAFEEAARNPSGSFPLAIWPNGLIRWKKKPEWTGTELTPRRPIDILIANLINVGIPLQARPRFMPCYHRHSRYIQPLLKQPARRFMAQIVKT